MPLSFRIKLSILWSCLFIFSSCQDLKTGDYFQKIGDLKLNYSIRGKGPVMIVGHLTSGKIGYQLTLQALEEIFTMVYYEPRGTGKSDAPKLLNDYQKDYIVNEIEALRKHLKIDKIWIFGHSDQSAIALEYALKFPNNVNGLLLSGTSFVGTQEESIKRRQVSEAKRSHDSPWFSQVIKDWDYKIKYKTDKDNLGRNIADAPIKWWCYDGETAQKVIPIVKEISKAGRRKSINGQTLIESTEERQKYLDIQKRFPEIKTKILIINGKFDTNNPVEYAEKLRDNLPNSELQLIDKAGHFPWIENPKDTFEAINLWLNQSK